MHSSTHDDEAQREALLDPRQTEKEYDESAGRPRRVVARWNSWTSDLFRKASARRRNTIVGLVGLFLFWYLSRYNYTHQGAHLVRRHVPARRLRLDEDQRLRILRKLDAHLAKQNPITGSWSSDRIREGVLVYETIQRARNCLYAEQQFTRLSWPRRLLALHPQDVRITDDGTCAEHLKIAIVWSDYCNGALDQYARGEDVQCRSMLRSLASMGYGLIPIKHNHNRAEVIYYHDLLEDLVRVVVAQDPYVRDMFKDEARAWVEGPDAANLDTEYADDSHYREAEGHGRSIPLHKLFVLDWWGLRENKTPVQPLGTEWYLTPFEMPDHSYIGFSIEDSCDPDLVVAPENRTRTALILGKKAHYFKDFAWKPDTWEQVAARIDVQFRGHVTEGDQSLVPEAVVNGGRVSREEYSRDVAQSAVMVGLGVPGSSPSPYVALCQGTPFINPHRTGAPPVEEWYKSNNIFEWQQYQHGPLAFYGPPHVYNVEQGDVDGLVEAISSAVANPIDSWIPEEMTEVANRDRAAWLLERDWKSRAEERARELGTTVAEIARSERARLLEWQAQKAREDAERAAKKEAEKSAQ